MMWTYVYFLIEIIYRYIRVWWYGPLGSVFETTVSYHRVGLNDVDLNMHLNNCKYLEYMQSMRMEHLLRSATTSYRTRGLSATIGSNMIRYKRELRFWAPFAIKTRYVGYDHKFFYIEQHFCARSGDVVDPRPSAHSFTKLAFLKDGAVLAPAEVLKLMDAYEESPPIPEAILRWNESELAASAGLKKTE